MLAVSSYVGGLINRAQGSFKDHLGILAVACYKGDDFSEPPGTRVTRVSAQ
jgi:hypothetical protein